MAYVELTVEDRGERGSVLARKLRKSGFIPGVVYAAGTESRSVMVQAHDFVLIARKTSHTQLFKFKSSDAALNGKLALVKEVQVEPLKDQVLHVDFLGIEEGHRIVVEVALDLIGECAVVKEGKAVLNQTTYEIELECLPGGIPESIQVDVSGLREGQSIHAADLVLPEGVVLKSSPSLAIVSTVLPKAEAVATPAPEAAATPAPAKETGAKKA